MLHKMILSLALTFLLGFSQQSALLHEISHLADINPLSEQQSEQLGQIPQQDQAPQHAANCEHCLGFSHFANSVNSSHQHNLKVQANDMPAIFASRHHQPHSPQAYTARGPPPVI